MGGGGGGGGSVWTEPSGWEGFVPVVRVVKAS